MSFPIVSLVSFRVLTSSSLRSFRYVRIRGLTHRSPLVRIRFLIFVSCTLRLPIQLLAGFFSCVPPAQSFRILSLIRMQSGAPFGTATLV